MSEPDKRIDNCLTLKTNAMFWLAQNRINSSFWKNPYESYTNFANFKIDAIDGVNCAYMVGNAVKSQACDAWFPCGVCNQPKDNWMYMKGMCPIDIKWYFDTKYYIYGTRGGRPMFRYNPALRLP